MLQGLVYNREKGLRPVQDGKQAARLLRNQRSLLWIDITNPSEDDIDLMVDVFRFHPLAIEDAIFPQNLPKLDDYSDYVFLVVHEMLSFNRTENTVQTQELNIFLGKNYILTIHGEPVASVSKLFKRLQAKPQAMQQGSGMLLHAIIDTIVDNYFPVVDQLEEQIEKLEDQVLSGADQSVLEKIVDLKKGVLLLRNFIVPQRKVLGLLTRSGLPFIRVSLQAFFRDVYDHVVRVSDILDTYRDVLNSTMDAYLSVMSNRMNEIIKTLTIITTIMMPLTLITSFYGMNVKMPEFGWGIKGYWVALGLLGTAFAAMLFFLKKRKWI